MMEEARKFQTRPYDIFILILTLASLGVVLLLELPIADPATHPLFLLLDWGFSLVFLLDFLVSLYRAPNKWAFMRWGWLDLLGSLPAISYLRIFRLARVYRAIRIMQRVSAREMVTYFIRQRAESTLWATGIIVVLLTIASSILILRLEASYADANIQSAADALWWVFVTITTVGYGDKYPVSGTGRLLAALLMTAGVGLFGVLTSYLATTFITPGEREQEAELAEIRQELAEIKALLQEYKKDQA